MSATTTSLAGRLRSAFDAISRDPTVIVDELRFGPPASPEALAAAGGIPADLLGLYAEVDGIDFAWRSRDDDKDEGGLHVPPIADVWPPYPHEFDEPLAYVMIDDLRDGFACFYELHRGKSPSEPSIIYAQVAFVAGTGNSVCKTFTEYLALVETYRFHWTWIDQHEAKARRARLAAKK